MSDFKEGTPEYHLQTYQEQLDPDGCNVGVSRQAVDEVLDKLKEAEKEIAELRERNIQIANWCNEQTGEIRRQQSDIKELAQALKEAADILSDVYPTMDDARDKYQALANKHLKGDL